jgi:hypothetical protein
MIEEEIKKEIIDIINKNRYYISKKEVCKLLLEIVDDINPINDENINEEIQDITDYAFNNVCEKVKVVFNRYHIIKTAQ